jgi:hypothetical protein
MGGCDGLPGPGRTYSCIGGDPGSRHCYGIVRFNVTDLGNGPSFRAFITTVNAVALRGGDGEINDEFWVKQIPAANCGGPNLPAVCWIEVGLSAGANYIGCRVPQNETHLFWADNRPNRGFFCHDMGAVQPQEFGQPVLLAIAIRPSEPNAYDVEALTCESSHGPVGCQGRQFVGISSDNTMAANVIDMGMELAGRTGASAPGTNFFQTLVPDSSSVFGFKFLDVDGRLILNEPISAEWESRPTSGNGGSFRTSCCRG